MKDEAVVHTENRMEVPKEVMNELLLVCSVITSTSAGEKVVPVTDCVNWLQDLQRVLRRDDDVFRAISLTVGSWKIVEKKLIPLVIGCRYNWGMVLTIVKILVILTKPMHPDVMGHVRGADCKDLEEAVLAEQMKMHKNALAQNKQLMEYKRLVCGGEGNGLISVLCGLLAEPLSREGARRTDSDHMVIELVLHLLRNLLAAQPLMKTNAEASREAEQLHHKLLSLLENELALDLVLAISQQLEAPENAHYNLLILEILHHMFRNQDPTLVAQAHLQRKDKKQMNKTTSLKSQLLKEKSSLSSKAINVRHANFGGSVVLQKGGTKKVISSSLLNQPSLSFNGKSSKRKPNGLPFIGNKHTGTADSTRYKLLQSQHLPTTHKSHLVLNKFCKSFLSDAFGPFAKSLKHEFRRDSVRLEEADVVLFFRICTFFFQWYRKNSDAQSNPTISNLVFSMDVFSFTMLLNAMDRFQSFKRYNDLEPAVALYKEMATALYRMRTSTSKDDTEKVMAMGLMDTLFYTQEPSDKLLKLISWWKTGCFTRAYMCDLVEITHVTLKLLDIDHVESSSLSTKSERRKSKQVYTDITSRFQAAASDFSPFDYFQKLVSPHLTRMYTDLLSQYQLNTPQVNHHIIAFFTRMCKTVVNRHLDISQHDDIQNIIRSEMDLKNVTLEPMLYNFHSIATFTNILQGISLQEEENESMVKFIVSFFRRFSKATERNPMLFVECLIRHPVPGRYCNSVTNCYVTEELIMMCERDMLMQARDANSDNDEDVFGEDENDVRPDDENVDEQQKSDNDINESGENVESPEDDEELEISTEVTKELPRNTESKSLESLRDKRSADAEEEDIPIATSEFKRLKKRHVIEEDSDEENTLFE